MPLTLIQLISEQTIQNLLPILRLRPQELIHLVTPKTAGRCEYLRTAVLAAGLDPDWEEVHLSAMPGIPECFNALNDVIEQVSKRKRQAVVNFTGGTKLMSIGAYAAARMAHLPSLYVNTQDACFMDGATSPEMAALLRDDWSFTPIHKHLSVDALGVANGVARITAGKPWRDMLPLAEYLFHTPQDEAATFEAMYGTTGLCPRGSEPRTPEDWLAAVDRPIILPETVARLAAEVGLVRPDPSPGTIRLPDSTQKQLSVLARKTERTGDFLRRYFEAVAPLHHTCAFLTGAWWEVIVCDAAQKSGLFRDLRWSAQVGAKNAADTEEDILGMDGVELLYVNCKRGGAGSRLLPLLEELRGRAATIGGSFNRRFLAVLNAPSGSTGRNLRERAQRAGIRLLTRETVSQPGIFDR